MNNYLISLFIDDEMNLDEIKICENEFGDDIERMGYVLSSK